jgi:hypothetical protein
MIISGVLALAGLSGVILDDPRARNIGIAGEPHSIIRADTISPRTPTETLQQIIARDEAPVSRRDRRAPPAPAADSRLRTRTAQRGGHGPLCWTGAYQNWHLPTQGRFPGCPAFRQRCMIIRFGASIWRSGLSW